MTKMNKDEAKKYVMATIKTGNAKRIKEVMDRYLKAFPDKPKATFEDAKKLFET